MKLSKKATPLPAAALLLCAGAALVFYPSFSSATQPERVLPSAETLEPTGQNPTGWLQPEVPAHVPGEPRRVQVIPGRSLSAVTAELDKQGAPKSEDIHLINGVYNLPMMVMDPKASLLSVQATDRFVGIVRVTRIDSALARDWWVESTVHAEVLEVMRAVDDAKRIKVGSSVQFHWMGGTVMFDGRRVVGRLEQYANPEEDRTYFVAGGPGGIDDPRQVQAPWPDGTLTVDPRSLYELDGATIKNLQIGGDEVRTERETVDEMRALTAKQGGAR